MSLKRSSGAILHPTALPSNHGIGDFGDEAYKFVDFLEQASQKYWQMLPLGHTSFGDSPYQCFSAFAGNPLLISPEKMVKLGLISQDDIAAAQEGAGSQGDISCLNSPYVDFENVIPYKNEINSKAFEGFNTLKNSELFREFKQFCRDAKFWLDDYAFFVSYKNRLITERRHEDCDKDQNKEFKAYADAYGKSMSDELLLDTYYGASWHSWKNDVKHREKAAVKRETAAMQNDVEYIKFIQFIFYKQYKELKGYANSKNIEIIGDVPIFVALDSADVWAKPELFDLDTEMYPSFVAGVPPDYFSADGQLWGNPLYNYDVHEETGFDWWIKRIGHAMSMFDLTRIDHFRGFEAFWAVKNGEKTAENGKWVKAPGKMLFRAAERALGKLPIIAEDLGVITPGVEKLRDFFGFPGMKILQYGFDEDMSNTNKPHNFRSANVIVYTGTHDNDTTIGWYNSLDEKTADRVRRYMNVPGAEISWDLIRLALMTNADVAIFPVQDILSLGTECRFNTPGSAGGNWSYRMKHGELAGVHALRLRYLTEIAERAQKREDVTVNC